MFGWLALVAVVFLAGQAQGTRSLPSYDAGQSGRAEQILHRLGAAAPAVEDVLIQFRGAGHPFADDPAMQQAVRQVAGALAGLPHPAADIRSPDIRSPLTVGNRGLVSADGRSALVTFQAPDTAAGQPTAVAPAWLAVAAVAARYPGLRIVEAGDATYGRAISSLLDSGFRRAESTSVPITLVLLLFVWGMRWPRWKLLSFRRSVASTGDAGERVCRREPGARVRRVAGRVPRPWRAQIDEPSERTPPGSWRAVTWCDLPCGRRIEPGYRARGIGGREHSGPPWGSGLRHQSS